MKMTGGYNAASAHALIFVQNLSVFFPRRLFRRRASVRLLPTVNMRPRPASPYSQTPKRQTLHQCESITESPTINTDIDFKSMHCPGSRHHTRADTLSGAHRSSAHAHPTSAPHAMPTTPAVRPMLSKSRLQMKLQIRYERNSRPACGGARKWNSSKKVATCFRAIIDAHCTARLVRKQASAYYYIQCSLAVQSTECSKQKPFILRC